MLLVGAILAGTEYGGLLELALSAGLTFCNRFRAGPPVRTSH